METLVTSTIEGQVATPVSAGAEAGLSAALKKFSLITIPKKKGAPVPPADALHVNVVCDLVHEIENLSKEGALARLSKLDASHEQSLFEIGGVLSVFQKNEWFSPYASFDKWVEAEVGMKRGKARALIRVYDVVVKADLSADQFAKIDWTKLRTLVPVLTHDNADYWSQAAAEHSRTKLEELVKQSKSSSGDSKTKSSTAAHKWTFKFHDDQNEIVTAALNKAKAASGTEYDSAALELICLDYMGGQSLAERMKTVGVKNALKALDEAFPGFNFTVTMPESSTTAACAE